MISVRNKFATRDALAEALAEHVADDLSTHVQSHGAATLAVSGGTTPALFFKHLSAKDIAWGKIAVTLVDERQVPESSPRSNAGLVKAALLQNRAAKARFVPLYQNLVEASQQKLDVVVLGMGNDGHTASFFPGGDTLSEAIDPTTERAIIAISAPGSGEPRLTFTLPKLLAATTLCLHIEGAGKLAVLDSALACGENSALPIRAVLAAATPLHLYWCP